MRAPGAGRVVWAADGRSDWEVGRTSLPFDDIMADATSMMGNSVVIDHGNGEFSPLAHFQKGSVRVRIGQRVRQGEPLGLVGDSGSVFTVHLHYELRGGVPLDVDGLPSRFNRLDRWLGRRREAVQDGFVDTGDVIESR